MPCFILWLTSNREIIYQYNGSKPLRWSSTFLVASKIPWCSFISSFLLCANNKLLQSCHKEVIHNHPVDLNRKVHVRITQGRDVKNEWLYVSSGFSPVVVALLPAALTTVQIL